MNGVGPMSSFLAPAIPQRVFYDDDGAPIAYGDRWDWGEGPAQWSYSVERNLERFEPLITYAEALIEHLARVCDVEVTDDPSCAQDLMHGPYHEVRRAVRLAPTNPSAAPLAFVFSGPVYLTVHAGLATDFRFPPCTCEACDETAEGQIEELAQVVAAVTTGTFQEIFKRNEHGFEIQNHSSSWGRTAKENRPRVKAARAAFAKLGPWQPWPLRAT